MGGTIVMSSQWRQVRLLGQGSFSKVYEIARTDELGMEEHAALKVISIPQGTGEQDDGVSEAGLAASYRQQAEKLIQEVEIMRSMGGNSHIVNYMDHSIVPHTKDSGCDIYIRMELLKPLPQYYQEQYDKEPVREEDVIRLGIHICKALELCAENRIIHRDIKPQNIFLNQNGDFKLGDFGIAQVARQNGNATIAGTMNYMAPEVFRGQAYSAAVDLYSLGLVMYWMLNQRRMPFLPLPPENLTFTQIEQANARRLRGDPLPRPVHGSKTLTDLVLRACAFRPEDRYLDPRTLRNALEQVSGGTVVVRPPAPKPRDKTCRVVFRRADGKIISDSVYPAGAALEVPAVGDWADKKYRYVFTGWQPAVRGSRVTQSCTYTARYRRIRKRSVLPILAGALGISLALTCGILAARRLSETPEQTVQEQMAETDDALHTDPATGVSSWSEGDEQGSVVKLSLEEAMSLALLQDGYACIGAYDLQGKELEDSAKLTFPVDSYYEGATVEIAYPKDSGREILTAVVEDGAVTVETDACGPFLLQVKPDQASGWSAWDTTLPQDVAADDLVEYAVLYHSRERETTTSQEDTMEGWTLYDTSEGEAAPGAWSDWSTSRLAEERAEVEERQEYRYRDLEVTSSSQEDLQGWTQYASVEEEAGDSDWSEWSVNFPGAQRGYEIEEKVQYRYRTVTQSVEYSAYSAWNPWQDAPVAEDDVTEVETRTAYHYYYYVCSNCGAHMHGYGQCYTWAGGCGKNTVEHGSYHMVRYTTPYSEAKDFHGTTVYYAYGEEGIAFAYISASSPHYVAPLTQYRYRTRTKETVEQFSDWSPWDETAYVETQTRKVEARTVYRYRIAQTETKYYYYRWSEWSPWGTAEYSENDSRQVEVRTVYRSRESNAQTIYHFYRWPEGWTDWSFSAPEASESVQVEREICYRYRPGGGEGGA